VYCKYIRNYIRIQSIPKIPQFGKNKFLNGKNPYKFVSGLIKNIKIRNYDQNYNRNHSLYLQFFIAKRTNIYSKNTGFKQINFNYRNSNKL
jgi:hypothetical protein